MDRMEDWLSSIGSKCDIPEIWELFLDKFKKQVTAQRIGAKGIFQKMPNAPQMSGTNFEVYLQEFDDFLINTSQLSDAQKKETFCQGLTTCTMIDVLRQGPCSFATAKFQANLSVKHQKRQWVEKTLREATTIHPDLQEVAKEIRMRPSSPQTEKQINELQKQRKQRWELAELIRQKDEDTSRPSTEPMPQELYHALQTPVPFQLPNYPAPLQELFKALHIDPPQFAMPEKEEDIASTPPTSPTVEINYMMLRTVPHQAPSSDSQKTQVYTMDDTTRIHAPAQTTNENVYIPKYKSMYTQVYLHTCEKWEEEQALLNSGATENFMNLTYVR